uniref:VWFA domain-containing protein n=1 Tax=viral metagenome TaxID=1070528 RepID=A0A6C0I602_9ZZZZ
MSIQRHTVATNIPLLAALVAEGFGILTIKTEPVPATRTPCFLLFSLDTTGSMDEGTGAQGVSKLDYVKSTFRNMLRYLATLSETSEIYIKVNRFDYDVATVIDLVRVTNANVNVLIERIQQLSADGLTALDKPLQLAAATISEYATSNPTHTAVHIFMTDGTPTAGESRTANLVQLVDDHFINVFVGYGSNHNADLMRQCSAKEKASYLFIDNAEDTSLFYGEALHQILYPAISNVTIRATSSDGGASSSEGEGQIYNWKTNTWSNELREDVIIGDCTKTYHVKSNPNALLTFELHGIDHTRDPIPQEPGFIEEIDEVPHLIDTESGEPETVDLTNYMFRQLVLEKLFKATSYSTLTGQEKRIYRESLEELFRVMRRSMRERGLDDDPFMLRLCDDIKVTHSTLNSQVGLMYTMARQSSQGRQQLFSPSNRPVDADEEERTLTRAGPARYGRMFDDDDDERAQPTYLTNAPNQQNRADPSNHSDHSFRSDATTEVPEGFVVEDELAHFVTEERDQSCYATPAILDTVRQLSQP